MKMEQKQLLTNQENNQISEAHSPISDRADYSKQLLNVGFKNASKICIASKFKEIKLDRIYDFLFGKAIQLTEKELQNVKGITKTNRNPRKLENGIGFSFRFGETPRVWYDLTIVWEETKVEEYNGIPPQFVLEK